MRAGMLAPFVVAAAITPLHENIAPNDALTIRVGLARPQGGYTVVSVPFESYVARVLAGEAARDSAPAALDALAITIRTFALANRTRHRADGFDLCDQTHCQVVRTATAATEASAIRTSGRVLLAGASPASIFYTASCGGRTEVPSAVWPGAADPPFLISQRDTACGGGPAWSVELRDDDLLRALRAAGFSGDRLRRLRILARDGSGRVARLAIEGLAPPEISGQDLRVAVGRTLGWQQIKSTAFEITRIADGYRLDGHGSGHGVGLCVIGSARLAAEGESAEKILQRYFPGLRVGAPTDALLAAAPAPTRRPGANVVNADNIVIAMPSDDDDQGERATLSALVSRARDDLARTLGVPPPANLVVRVHATTDAYEQALGRPWFTFGAIVNGELHLLPLAALRERGVLERTIRRELVRAMIDPVLASRPLWVRDGAAVYYADPGNRQPPRGRVTCPDERDLAHPLSLGALATAYAQARACFVRQIAAGRSWRDVK